MINKALRQKVLDNLAVKNGKKDWKQVKIEFESNIIGFGWVDIECAIDLTLLEVSKEIDSYCSVVKAFLDHPPEDKKEAKSEKEKSWAIYNALEDLKKRLSFVTPKREAELKGREAV